VDYRLDGQLVGHNQFNSVDWYLVGSVNSPNLVTPTTAHLTQFWVLPRSLRCHLLHTTGLSALRAPRRAVYAVDYSATTTPGPIPLTCRTLVPTCPTTLLWRHFRLLYRTYRLLPEHLHSTHAFTTLPPLHHRTTCLYRTRTTHARLKAFSSGPHRTHLHVYYRSITPHLPLTVDGQILLATPAGWTHTTTTPGTACRYFGWFAVGTFTTPPAAARGVVLG